jgi:hypothetical protein
LSSKWHLEQWRNLAWSVRCSATSTRIMNVTLSRPRPSQTTPDRFLACCEVGVYRAKCCALSLALAPGPSLGEIGRVDSTRGSQLKLRDKATEPAPNPLKHIIREVCNHAKDGSVFRSGCQGIPCSCCEPCHGLILDKSKAPTNMQSCMQPGSKSKLFSEIVKSIYIVRSMVVCYGLKSAGLCEKGDRWASMCSRCQVLSRGGLHH